MISRILIVGLGSIGKRHLRLARELKPDADIRILRHGIATKNHDYSDGYFFNIKDAINFLPHVAVIANPATHHIPIAQKLAEKGVHLLIEKPLSVSLRGIDNLIATCKRKNAVLSVGYNLRYLKSLQYFKSLIDKGVAGKIFSVRCEAGQYLPSWRPGEDYRAGVSAKKELGGGVLLELSHELDYLRWIFGEIEWVTASLSHQSNLEINVEDTAHLLLGFVTKPNKAQLIGAVNLDFIRHDSVRKCVAIGQKASLMWDGISFEVKILNKSKNQWKKLFKQTPHKDESYLLEWKNFLLSIKNSKSPKVTGKDGQKILHIINAARKSAKINKKVYVIGANLKNSL